MKSYEDLKEGYEEDLERMTINESALPRLDSIARRAIANKQRYMAVAKQMNKLPWQFIAILHYRESNMDFNTHLHNGDPLTHRTVHVPSGRPINGTPPFTWEESAVDALNQKKFADVPEWPMSRIAYEGERYNGFGYRSKKIDSPYLWSGTNVYKQGKYVADGVYDPNEKDKQLGILPLLNRILALDVSDQTLVKSSRKLKLLSRTKAAISATFGGYLSLDYFNAIPEYIQKYQALGLPKEIYVISALVVVTWLVITVVEKYTLDDYKEGRYTPSGEPENDVVNKEVKL